MKNGEFYFNNMRTVSIFFDDLKPEAQAALLEAAGIDKPEDANWDLIPLATVDFEERDNA